MSDDIVIRAENISKRYRISHLGGHVTLRDTMHHMARLAWRRLRWNRRLNQEDFWALRDASFEIKRGEVVGIIGRNGAGKSTLLKVLSRITEPTSGRITLKGRVASLLEVGTGFHPELTGRDNIYLNGAILGMSRSEIRKKFDEIVAFAEVSQFLDTPVKRYSSGMYVRLAFAVAAHLEPEILIVDEVLAVGDAEFQKKCLGKMQEVAQGQGRTVLLVSHNLKSIEQLCHRAIHLEAGRVLGIGPASEIASAYTRGDHARQTEVIDRPLSDKLKLNRLALPRAECAGRGQLPYELSITATSPIAIQEIFLLVHNEQGERVGLLDLRHPAGARRLAAGQTLVISGVFSPCLLTEGEYLIGLFMHADNEQRAHPDLVRFIVRPAPAADGMPPVITQSLGVMLLDKIHHKETILPHDERGAS